jgi:alpha-D-ribose 1-methylphosphonate 5-triphosphate synthase subunit PhnG
MAQPPNHPNADRKAWMSLLAKASPIRLQALMPDLPQAKVLRPPEIGAVMVQGRVGGTGSSFNLGEMTVTRCSVQLADGVVGHAYVQGRDKDHAMRAAVLDALLQTGQNPHLQTAVLEPLRAEADTLRATRAGKAAATKVEFFTMVRGEDK